MANSSEIIKLVILLGGGIIIAIVGQIIINKKRAAKKNNDLGFELTGTSSQEDPENESKAQTYISQYKTQYPRESIKQGLKNMGINDYESEKYLNKYL